ncbi:efflux RND transporter permease subunit [Polymorphobacter sp. PAMC 29334]|uniref:efflux RND transporter permease subunit n=1 Tax=Polymorphobacter sp. PAMC 29334 TaxID=2862331 RepID=UPI001C7867DA|nr:efflux RND transporter permease subunit [Polymorphobacter sp. PAMC 29334]QYE35120.1 efflux RND transporter permease subunit [Polymorphobacter sp. PAMC 29334]
MSLSSPFVRRPIATILLTIGIALSGIAAYFVLPVSPLPQVDFPTISINASLSGASPATMASSVATPLERRLGTIADVSEMTSQSGTGSTRITLQFNLDRDINGAARDVQAAIAASRVDLPATLRSNPTYRKINAADAPIMILALTSKTRSAFQIYDAVSNIVQQRLSQVDGVGEVQIGGGSLPSVRIDVNPLALAHLGLSLEDVRAAIAATNPNRPKGTVDAGGQRFQIYTSAARRAAADYRPLIIAYRNGAAVRLSDVAEVTDGPEDARTIGLFNGKPAVVAIISRQPGANIIAAVEAVKAQLPGLRAGLPADIDMAIASDRTTTIRASLRDVEVTLLIATLLVVLVVSVFLRSWRATVVPAVAVVVSLLGTLGVMYLLGFSLNNLSLMALTVATGFVVDDAIVVLENIVRHIEDGMPRMEAALTGAKEVGFTVLSISISLVAVFIPLLFMGGIVGRLFREFAITLSASVMISLVISLTTTPMICALLLKDKSDETPGRFARVIEGGFDRTIRGYAKALDWALDNAALILLILVATIGINVYLWAAIPKGFFPEQDTGSLNGGVRLDQRSSFAVSAAKLTQLTTIVAHDPDIATVVGFTGGGGSRGGGGGFAFAQLKPKGERSSGSNAVIARLRPKLARVTGAALFLSPVQDVRVGGRQGNATYQYTLSGDDADTLPGYADKMVAILKRSNVLTDIDADTQQNGVETFLTVDRDRAARLGTTARDVDNILYDAFGQRGVSTIYSDLNQYKVIMEAAAPFRLNPDALANIYVPANAPQAAARGGGTSAVAAGSIIGATATTAQNAAAPAAGSNGDVQASGSALSAVASTMIPLAAFSHYDTRGTASSINHQAGSPAATISFNLAPGKSLSDATPVIADALAQVRAPADVHGSFAGTAKAFQDSLKSTPLLILSAIVVIYIVLGMLYESLIHPLTVLSTLPSAGVGAVIALLASGTEFSIIALIGVVLLIGIVKKNAILIIDFALAAEREQGLSPREAITRASLLRFRPIVMTTLAAVLGAVPLAIGWGEGAELRHPLGIAIIGGLLVSQVLTLLTTPVVYLALDRFRHRSPQERAAARLHPEFA